MVQSQCEAQSLGLGSLPFLLSDTEEHRGGALIANHHA